MVSVTCAPRGTAQSRCWCATSQGPLHSWHKWTGSKHLMQKALWQCAPEGNWQKRVNNVFLHNRGFFLFSLHRSSVIYLFFLYSGHWREYFLSDRLASSTFIRCRLKTICSFNGGRRGRQGETWRGGERQEGRKVRSEGGILHWRMGPGPCSSWRLWPCDVGHCTAIRPHIEGRPPYLETRPGHQSEISGLICSLSSLLPLSKSCATCAHFDRGFGRKGKRWSCPGETACPLPLISQPLLPRTPASPWPSEMALQLVAVIGCGPGSVSSMKQPPRYLNGKTVCHFRSLLPSPLLAALPSAPTQGLSCYKRMRFIYLYIFYLFCNIVFLREKI